MSFRKKLLSTLRKIAAGALAVATVTAACMPSVASAAVRDTVSTTDLLSTSVSTAMDVNFVTSVDNAMYPQTDKFITGSSSRSTFAFEIESPTIIKVYANYDAEYISYVQCWLSHDPDGIDPIGEPVNIYSAEDYVIHCLDPGTYYVNYNTVDNGSTTDQTNLKAGVYLVGQKSKSTEDRYSTSFAKPNNIESGAKEYGFLSITAPNDIYRFTVKEKTKVTVKFNFDEYTGFNTYNAKCALLNASHGKITEANYNSYDTTQNVIEQIIPAGTYFIKMSGAETSTTLSLKTKNYEIVPIIKVSGQKVTMSLKIPYDAYSVDCKKGNVSKSQMYDYYYWQPEYDKNAISVHGRSTVTITKNGWYTYRIMNEKQEYEYFKVNITQCNDKTKPLIHVTNGKTYKKGKTIYFEDHGSGLSSVTVNGKKISKSEMNNGYVAKKNGRYTVVARDKAGNTTTKTFKVK